MDLRGHAHNRSQYANRLPLLFAVIGIFLAFAYATIVPPFQVPDEDRHFWRSYSVSQLHLIPPARTEVPESFMRLHDRFPPWFERMPSKRVVHAAELISWLRQPLDPKATVAIENPNGNLYSFVPHMATALALKLGGLAQLSPLMLLYAGRFANAAVYVCLLCVAICIIPEFKLALLTIALSPMSLHLAASFSADSLTLGLSAVLTAYIFKLAFDDEIINVQKRDLLILVAVLSLLALCKFNILTALLVALIPARKFGSRTRATLFLAACILVCAVAALVWQSVNSAAIGAFLAGYAANGKSVTDNAAFLLHHPIRVLEFMILTDSQFLWILWQEFIGMFGWLDIQMSPMHVLMYTGAMLSSALMQSGRVVITRWQKAIAASFVVLTFVSIHALLWIYETRLQSLSEALHGWVFIRGVQGRYLIPLALPALILLKRRFQPNGLLLAGTLAVVIGINFFALMTISLVYS